MQVEIVFDRDDFTETDYKFVIDNGGRFNKYILETTIGTDITNDVLDLTYDVGTITLVLKQLDFFNGLPDEYVTSSLNITICDEDLVEAGLFMPSYIYSDGASDPVIMEQSSNIIKIYLRKPITCCLDTKIELDKSTVCSIPDADKVDII